MEMALILFSLLLHECLILLVIFLQGGVFLIEFLFVGVLVLVNSLRDAFGGHIIERVVDANLLVDSHILGNLVRVDILELSLDSILLGARNVDHSLEVQALDEIFGQDKWRSDHDIVDVFAG